MNRKVRESFKLFCWAWMIFVAQVILGMLHLYFYIWTDNEEAMAVSSVAVCFLTVAGFKETKRIRNKIKNQEKK